MRENAGFNIIVAVPVGKDAPFGKQEVVVGYRLSSLGDQYVCWYCTNGNDYYWGRYVRTWDEVMEVLIDRLSVYHSDKLKGTA